MNTARTGAEREPEARDVVITGMGAISAAGVGVEALWASARDGVPCGGPITRFDPSSLRSRIAGECTGFDPAAGGLDGDEAARMDLCAQFTVVAAREALAMAGLLDGALARPERAGVWMGTAIGGVGVMEDAFRNACIRGDARPTQVSVRPGNIPRSIYTGFLAYSVSHEVARRFGMTGFCSTMATGCTAGIDAITAASDVIRCGRADIMVTGGVDAPIILIVVASFDVIKALTRRNDEPRRASRPYDRDRDGFLLSEGCGVVVLEEETHARARGARILGRVLGHASRSNAYHMTGLPADGLALADTIRAALRNARVLPEQVDYINSHGSSTQQNDRNETSAYKRVFGEGAYGIPISSTKSVVGHSLGAASALETVVCVCALLSGTVPPTANYETPCPDCDLDYVPNRPRSRPLRVVQSNASSFSGIHTSVILGHPGFSIAAP